MDDIERIKKKIKSSKRYKSLRSTFTTSPVFQVTIDEYRNEIRSLFTTRRFRSLNPGGSDFDAKFLAAITQDQSTRSRMTEILAEVSAARRELNTLVEKFQEYAMVAYVDDLKAVGAAKERERFLNMIVRSILNYGSDLNNLAEEIDFYVKDIDKAGYAAKNLVEMMSVLYRRDGALPTIQKGK